MSSNIPSNYPTSKPSVLPSSSPSLKPTGKKCVDESGKSKKLNSEGKSAKTCSWFAKEKAKYRKVMCNKKDVLNFCYKTCTGC